MKLIAAMAASRATVLFMKYKVKIDIAGTRADNSMQRLFPSVFTTFRLYSHILVNSCSFIDR